MTKNRLLIYTLLLFSIVGCGEDDDVDEVSALPPSSIIYSELRPNNETVNFVFEESATVRFEDNRSFSSEDCGQFEFSISSADFERNIGLGLGITSIINPELLESNGFFFKNPDDFEALLERNIILNSGMNTCENTGETALIATGIFQEFFDIEGNTVLNIRFLSSDVEISSLNTNRILYNDLGYLNVNLELTGVSTILPSFSELPLTITLNHALRFPEIDRW